MNLLTRLLLITSTASAVTNCKWSKYRPVLSHIATAVAAEDEYRNRGPSRNSAKKARQRNCYKPWYHKLYLRANSANVNTPQEYINFHACTALDLNEDGTRLTSASALKGPEKLLWEKAHGEEIIRLIESQTGRFSHRQRRVRGTAGGDQVQYPGITAAYTAHLETIRVLI